LPPLPPTLPSPPHQSAEAAFKDEVPSVSAPLSLIPAALFVGADDDDDDKPVRPAFLKWGRAAWHDNANVNAATAATAAISPHIRSKWS